MKNTNLPNQIDQLEQLLDQAAHLAAAGRSTHALLQDVESRPDAFGPAELVPLPWGAGCALVTVGVTSLIHINSEVAKVAALAMSVLQHLDLSDVDARRVRELALSRKGEGDDRNKMPDLFLAGVLSTGGEEIPEDVQNTDRLRLGVLVRVMEKLADAGEAFRRRLSLQLHPPGVRERVQVDRKGKVTVDGRVYDVADSHATLFYYLVEANGEPVSGRDIAREERVSEFKASRIVQQVKKRHPDLGAIIRKENRPNGRYCIELPTLK